MGKPRTWLAQWCVAEERYCYFDADTKRKRWFVSDKHSVRYLNGPSCRGGVWMARWSMSKKEYYYYDEQSDDPPVWQLPSDCTPNRWEGGPRADEETATPYPLPELLDSYDEDSASSASSGARAAADSNRKADRKRSRKSNPEAAGPAAALFTPPVPVLQPEAARHSARKGSAVSSGAAAPDPTRKADRKEPAGPAAALFTPPTPVLQAEAARPSARKESAATGREVQPTPTAETATRAADPARKKKHKGPRREHASNRTSSDCAQNNTSSGSIQELKQTDAPGLEDASFSPAADKGLSDSVATSDAVDPSPVVKRKKKHRSRRKTEADDARERRARRPSDMEASTRSAQAAGEAVAEAAETVEKAAEDAVEVFAEEEEAAEDTVLTGAVPGTAEETAGTTVNEAVGEAADDTVKEFVEEADEETPEEPVQQETAEEPAEDAVEEFVEESGDEPAKESAEETVIAAVHQESAEEPVEDAVEDFIEESVDELAEESAEETAKGTEGDAAETNGEKSVDKTSDAVAGVPMDSRPPADAESSCCFGASGNFAPLYSGDLRGGDEAAFSTADDVCRVSSPSFPHQYQRGSDSDLALCEGPGSIGDERRQTRDSLLSVVQCLTHDSSGSAGPRNSGAAGSAKSGRAPDGRERAGVGTSAAAESSLSSVSSASGAADEVDTDSDVNGEPSARSLPPPPSQAAAVTSANDVPLEAAFDSSDQSVKEFVREPEPPAREVIRSGVRRRVVPASDYMSSPLVKRRMRAVVEAKTRQQEAELERRAAERAFQRKQERRLREVADRKRAMRKRLLEQEQQRLLSVPLADDAFFDSVLGARTAQTSSSYRTEPPSLRPTIRRVEPTGYGKLELLSAADDEVHRVLRTDGSKPFLPHAYKRSKHGISPVWH
ncbi:putative ubiquitin-conjugating enzyme E2 R521 [Diplonema papillatum]|nr:putative ubiquitin-conjugating enzyme E2 R521 [Diplonema papillatum]